MVSLMARTNFREVSIDPIGLILKFDLMVFAAVGRAVRTASEPEDSDWGVDRRLLSALRVVLADQLRRRVQRPDDLKEVSVSVLGQIVGERAQLQHQRRGKC